MHGEQVDDCEETWIAASSLDFWKFDVGGCIGANFSNTTYHKWRNFSKILVWIKEICQFLFAKQLLLYYLL